MSAYGGYIQFQNLLRDKIKTGVAYHSTSSFNKETITLDGLPAGGISAPVPFFTSTSNTDKWGFRVTTASGTLYSAEVADEGFNNDNAGATVILQAVIADAETRTFNVSIPPCADHYGTKEITVKKSDLKGDA